MHRNPQLKDASTRRLAFDLVVWSVYLLPALGPDRRGSIAAVRPSAPARPVFPGALLHPQREHGVGVRAAHAERLVVGQRAFQALAVDV